MVKIGLNFRLTVYHEPNETHLIQDFVNFELDFVGFDIDDCITKTVRGIIAQLKQEHSVYE